MKGKELLKDEEVQKFVRRYIILYGVQLGVYTVVAICMQVWWQYFVFMISFIALRSFAGGYHAKRESVCVVQSGAIVLAACLTMKFIVISMQTVICIALLSGIMIFFHAPIEAEQKKLTDNERKKYRKTSRIVWIMEGILIVIACCFDSWLRIVAEPVIIAWFWVLVLAMMAAIRDVSKENE